MVVLGLLLLVAAAWWLIQQLTQGDSGRPRRAVQEISLMRPPPPAPPPPKVEPPKVEPPKMEVPQKQDMPKPDSPPEAKPDAPPPGPALGLDATGSGSGDSFGLAASKGGADLIGGGGGAGGTGGANRFAWYGALVKERIQEAIARDKALARQDYRVSVNVWIDGRGVVTRAELVDSTGDTVLDEAVRVSLRKLEPLREGAPGDMPQPVRLRITARG
jgi:protein TonB